MERKGELDGRNCKAGKKPFFRCKRTVICYTTPCAPSRGTGRAAWKAAVRVYTKGEASMGCSIYPGPKPGALFCQLTKRNVPSGDMSLTGSHYRFN